jgi:TRAP-type C4-dicarboxylate transport system substrate-binding protein
MSLLTPGPTTAPVRRALRIGTLAVALLLPSMVAAQPVELKLSFFASEQTDTFRYGVKPFVDAVNAEGEGVVAVKVYANGKLSKSVAEQVQLVLSGAADIAWVVPGQTPYRFPDNQALEMPGLFRDVREGTLVYTRLVAANALRGYSDFFVIAAYASAPSIIHSRKPITTLADLKGLKVRTNNPIKAESVARLGATPTIMPASMLADALAKGSVDAAIMSPTGLFQFGAANAARHHYLLGIGAAPLLVVMNRRKFDGLPKAAQALIRKYSGERAAAIWIESFGASEQQSIDRIKSDPQRTAVEPAAADREAAQHVYDALIEDWARKDPQNGRLVKAINAELSAIRTGNR